MDVSNLLAIKFEKIENKGSQMGHTKKIIFFKKKHFISNLHVDISFSEGVPSFKFFSFPRLTSKKISFSSDATAILSPYQNKNNNTVDDT